jgi:hypothetical protein
MLAASCFHEFVVVLGLTVFVGVAFSMLATASCVFGVFVRGVGFRFSLLLRRKLLLRILGFFYRIVFGPC